MYNMRINSNATTMLQNVINKVDSFPNMVASAQHRAIQRTISRGYDKMYRYGMAAAYLDMKVDYSGQLGAKITIKPDGLPNSKEYIAGSVFLKGRKGGKVIKPKPGKKLLKLRDESVRQGYPEFLAQVKLKGMKGYKSEIRRDLAELFIYEVEQAVRDVGFGPRGGAPSSGQDFNRMRVRFPKRSK